MNSSFNNRIFFIKSTKCCIICVVTVYERILTFSKKMQSLLSTEILINESHFDIVVSKTIALLIRPVIKNTILV